MRIVLITDQYHPMVGGVPVVTHRLAADLVARGHQVWVVAPGDGLHDAYYSEGGVTVVRWASLAWPAYEGQRLALAPAVRLFRLLKQIKPSVAHIHSPGALGVVAPLVARTLHIPVVATNHFMPMNMSRSFAGAGVLGRGFSWLIYVYLRGVYSVCDYVTFPTATSLKLVLKHGLDTPGEVVSNGVDLDRFHPGPRDERLRETFGLPSDRPLALTVSRLMREKRVHVLLEALARVRAPVHLVVAGSGPDARALQALARQLGVSQRVTFLGFVPDDQLALLYRLADMFVIASVAELQSLATMEAMACGLPTIAADAGALPELVADGENGYLFAADESDQLALVMEALLRQPERWRDMGRASVRMVARHDSRAVAEHWETIYRRVGMSAVARRPAGALAPDD